MAETPSVPPGWQLIRPSAFTSLIGPILCGGHSGGLHYAIRVESKHDNTHGRAHGGLIMAFCDEALGLAAHAARPGARLVTVSFNCEFIDGAAFDDFVQMEAEVVRGTKSLMFMRGICRADARVIAVCSGVWKIVAART